MELSTSREIPETDEKVEVTPLWNIHGALIHLNDIMAKIMILSFVEV
jgi:hypothetical protein